MKVLKLGDDFIFEVTPPVLEKSEVAVLSSPDKVIRANSSGLIDLSWVPLADHGEIAASKLVRADDPRLSNPSVGGDLSGTAGSATVIRIQGRSVSNTAPADGNALVWSHINNRWQPGEVASSGGGDGNATSIQGRVVSSAAPTENDALVWDGSAWVPSPVASSSGGDNSVGSKLIMFERYT